MLSNEQIKIIKYIKKHPKLSDILKYSNLTDEADLISFFPNTDSIRFDSDSYIDLNTNVSISPDTLAEFEEYNRSAFRFWITIIISNSISIGALIVAILAYIKK